ncbi:hypothetical protein IQ07DRAFT_582674 [Pyrenochaeta sp. DS3sAY3a]|nr:hypothetical protein IQ07DRAFT_582674 [Pyrenochaeta sp. DS3sAY3a]
MSDDHNSIKPPPDELWKDLGIEQLIEQFNEENSAPPVLRRNVSGNSVASVATPHHGVGMALTRDGAEVRTPAPYEGPSRVPTTPVGVPSVAVAGAHAHSHAPAPAASEGTFGRFRSAFASVFGNVLGKRKAGNVDAEKDKEKRVLDERKKAADAAYQEAKELGLLPTPKVFVRPAMGAKTHKCVADTATPARPPRTPTLYRTPSKKDLNKQKKLLRRVSDLEAKLAFARTQLQSVLNADDVPPVPPLPNVLPPTPTASPSEAEPSPSHNASHASTPAPEAPVVGKITKKRKAMTIDDADAEYKPIPTDSEGDISMSGGPSESEHERSERSVKRVKSTSRKSGPKRSGTGRLQKRRSRTSIGVEEAVIVVPDGVGVPPVPVLPSEVEVGGKKVKVGKRKAREGDGGGDGYGGLEHEMF